VDDGFLEIFGYERDEAVGAGPELIVAPESLPGVVAHMRSGSESRHVATGLRKDAMAVAQEAEKIAPEHPSTLLMLGRAHLANGNRNEALSALQKVAERQAEILKDSLDEATKAFETISKSATAKDAAAKQAELYQNAFAKALANMQELADMVAKSSAEATDVVNARLTENLEEIQALAKKMK